MDESLPEVRVGDRERRDVDDRLRAALDDGVLTLSEYDERAGRCWAARTRGDLDALTQDLPIRASAEPVPVAVPKATAPVSGPRVGRRVVGGLIAAAVIGGVLYLGGHVAGADDAVSVFSSRVVQVTPGQDRVEVGMVFGSVEVVVPDDVRVRPTGTLVFGSLDCDLACGDGNGLREVVLQADGAFGSVDVVRQSERDRDSD